MMARNTGRGSPSAIRQNHAGADSTWVKPQGSSGVFCLEKSTGGSVPFLLSRDESRTFGGPSLLNRWRARRILAKHIRECDNCKALHGDVR